MAETVKNGREKGQIGKGRAQPTSEQKRAGWLKKKRGAELVKAALELTFCKTEAGKEKRKQLSEFFGIPESKLTYELALILGQTKKAILEEDTRAATYVHERGFGKPAITVKVGPDVEEDPAEIVLPGGKKIKI